MKKSSQQSGHHDEFYVARSSEGVYIRVHGFGNLQNTPIFKAFVEKMIEEGFPRIVVDLGPCRGVDSTFMGTLLGLHKIATDQEAGAGVVLINTPSHCHKQLSSIGLDSFLSFVDSPQEPPNIEIRRLEATQVSASEQLQIIIKAHKDLIAADERNEAKFGPFLRSILKDI